MSADGDANEDGDGERILDLVGLGLVAFLILAGVVLVVAGNFASTSSDIDAPDVEWTTERINQSHVNFVHDGGEPVQADDLIVVVGKTDRGVRVNRTLTRGDKIAVPVTEDAQVALYWRPAETQRRALLARWESI